MRSAIVATLALGLALVGCAGRKKDEAEQPTPLGPIEESVHIDKAWSAKLGGEAENLRLGLTPASDGNWVYAAAHSGRVTAFDAQTGAEQWHTEVGLPLAAGPGYGDDMLVVGSTDGGVAALQARDGTVRWSRKLGAEIHARPVIASGRVFVRTVDGHVRALEQGSGNDLWTVEREVPRLSLRGNSAPVIAGNRIIVGFDDGKVASFDVTDGSQAWETVITPQHGRTEIERLSDIDADLQLVSGQLYVAGFQSRTVRIDAESGQEQWSLDLSSYEAPGIDWVHVYVTDDKSEVVALDRESGALAWRQSALRLRSVTGPTPFGQAVVVGDYEGYLHWLAVDDGRIIGRTRADGGAITNPPLVVGDTLYVQTDGGVLDAFTLPQSRRKEGTQQGQQQP
jgi:outer membrane protein assembly factor BamB